MALEKFSTKVEEHTPIIWWSLRVLETATCLFIIANVIHHW